MLLDHSKYDIFSNLIFLFQNNAFIIHLVICGHTQVCYMQEKCKWTFRIRNLSSVNKSDSDQIPLLEKLFMKRNGRIQILILEKPVRGQNDSLLCIKCPNSMKWTFDLPFFKSNGHHYANFHLARK